MQHIKRADGIWRLRKTESENESKTREKSKRDGKMARTWGDHFKRRRKNEGKKKKEQKTDQRHLFSSFIISTRFSLCARASVCLGIFCPLVDGVGLRVAPRTRLGLDDERVPVVLGRRQLARLARDARASLLGPRAAAIMGEGREVGGGRRAEEGQRKRRHTGHGKYY